MPARAEDSGIVHTEPKDLPVLAVHVLERLGYRVNRHSKRVGEIIASLQKNEQIGRDWFRSDYQVVLAFRKASEGTLVSAEVIEQTGAASSTDCAKRADEIIVKLQADAQRAKALAPHQEKSTVHGSARWGTDDDLRKAGYLTSKPPATQLIIGKTSTGEFISVPERVSYAHALVVGRTGVGKTTGFFIPNIVERLGVNMIITEATPDYGPGELYTLTSGWRKKAGHEVLSFNPSVMSSTRINPIDRVRHAPEEYKAREAERLADLVITNGERQGSRTDPAFDRSEKHLLMSLILHTAATDPEYGHFGALRWLLLSGVKEVQRTMRNSPSDVAQMEFEGWLRDTSEGFRFSVTAGLKTKLNPWLTDQMIALTEKTDIDFSMLNEKLFTFYIAVPNRSRDSQLIGSLMVNFLIDHILDQGVKMKHRTTIMLDEFTNFGKISNIADFLAIVRKARIGLVLAFQNYYQLERVYDRNEAKIIFDQPATQIFFQQKKFVEAKELSEALGRLTLEETTVSDTGRIMESVMGRALATPDELMRLERHCIAFTNDTPALKLPVVAPDSYKLALECSPPEMEMHEVSEFIRKRGRLSGRSGTEPTTDEEPRRNTRNERTREPKEKKKRAKDNERKPAKAVEREREPIKPDMGDVW
jgi:type IV secretory pathway TraG/TraD family ATPase VirD4